MQEGHRVEGERKEIFSVWWCVPRSAVGSCCWEKGWSSCAWLLGTVTGTYASHRWVWFMSHLRPPTAPSAPASRRSPTRILWCALQSKMPTAYTEGSDPALGICPRMEEAANGPSCHLSSGSLWGKVTQVVVGQRTQGRYQPSPQKCDVPLRITVNRFIILGNSYAGFSDRFQRVTGLVNPVGQELCYSCTTA